MQNLSFNSDIDSIKKEVEKDVRLILKEDRETAGFLKKVVFDYKLKLYLLLKWIDQEFNPQKILYPASGFDRVPKIAFGKKRVVHTSLEKKYLAELGEEIKVAANNSNLPFKSSTFNLILLLDSSFEIIGYQRDEILRVLKKGGLLVFARNIFQDDLKKDRVDYYKKLGVLNLKYRLNFNHNLEFFVLKRK